MSAQKGNDSAKKLKTKEIKEKVYKAYCEHIASGYSHKSFTYGKDGIKLTWNTMESYLKNDDDFDPIHKEYAIAQSLKRFEDIGEQMMTGKIEKCQPAIFQIIARNKFSWDKNTDVQETSKSAINVYVDRMKGDF